MRVPPRLLAVLRRCWAPLCLRLSFRRAHRNRTPPTLTLVGKRASCIVGLLVLAFLGGLAALAGGGVAMSASKGSPDSSAAAVGYRLVTTVRQGVVPVKNDVAQISCGRSFGKSQGRTFALAGGVRGNRYFAVGATFPAADAQGRPTGYVGSLTELPTFEILPGE